VVGNRDVIFDLRVVGNVRADHEKTSRADPGYTATAVGATMYRNLFAKHVVIADLKRCSRVGVTTILRR
jgi:hypothetical protein